MKRMFALLAVLLVAGAGQAYGQAYQVVVNAGNDVASLAKDDVSKMFLKQTGKWASGVPVVAVDLEKASKVRDAFSQAVHGRSGAAVATYWQQQIFSGQDVPPAEKGADAEVLAFVRSNPGGIGYVSAGAALGDGVKAVAVK